MHFNCRIYQWIVCLLAGVCLIPAGHAQVQQEAVVQVTGGYLKGKYEQEGYVFKGVPYAAPPVGQLRFKAPQAFPAWKDTLSCLEFSNMAAQNGTKESPLKGSEDCLSLNVYSPVITREKKLPVLVWIHGGGMTAGSGSGQNGHSFSDKDSIVTVTINYRLGVFGFLYLDDVDPSLKASGNNGLQDCIQALKWIHDNIEAFGGDPDKVTVIGESAGAKLAGTLLVAKGADHYFNQLILESGAVQCVRDIRTAIAIRKRLLTQLKLTDPKQLLMLPTAQLIAAQTVVCNGAAGTSYFGPVEDQLVISGDPYKQVAGRRKKIRVLMGTNKVESRLFMSMDKRLYQPDAKALQDWFGDDYPLVLKQYQKAIKKEEPVTAATNTLTQYMYQLHSYRLAAALAANHNPIWMYRFDYSRDSLGATHGRELPLVWFSTNNLKTATDLELATAIHHAWVNFIRMGDPGNISNNEWPLYSPEKPQVMILDANIHMEKLKSVFNDRKYPSAVFSLHAEL